MAKDNNTIKQEVLKNLKREHIIDQMAMDNMTIYEFLFTYLKECYGLKDCNETWSLVKELVSEYEK